MKYDQLKRRCENALADAIETKNDMAAEAIRNIIDSLDAGPLKPGDRVNTADYSKRVDRMLGQTAIVRACWYDELTGQYWATVEVGQAFATAVVGWFPKLTSKGVT